MTTTAFSVLPDGLKQLAQSQSERILQEVEGVNAVVIATVDGFEIASSIRSNLEPSRISALASSIAAIGDVVAQEAHLGETKSVTVDTTSGVAMIFSVKRTDISIVINVIADSRALFGQIAYQTAATARLFAQDR